MIKNKKTLLVAAAFSSLVLSSCDDMLDTKIDNTFTDDITWELSEFAMKVLNNGYYKMDGTFSAYSSNYLDVVTDNACTISTGSGIYNYVHGAMTPGNNFYNNWEACYESFQYIHLFLEKGLEDHIIYSLTDPNGEGEALKRRCEGEAYWLRAWWGYELLQRFGGLTDDGQALGYPIVTCYIADDVNASEHKHFNDVILGEDCDGTDVGSDYWNSVKRNTYEECVAQILADCDKAMSLLEFEYTDANQYTSFAKNQRGRADGRACLALKSRVSLLAASPAYQPTNATQAAAEMSLDDKWDRSIAASYDAIDQIGIAYKAFLPTWYVGTAVQKDEVEGFIVRKWSNNKNIEQYHFPPRFGGNANTQPSQNLVDAFPMANGYPITDARSNYDPQDPYTGRDARFARTVYVNGSNFNSTRPLQIYTTSTGVKGLDVAGDHYQNTKTGYYLQKTMSTKANMLYNPATMATQNDYHQHPFMRVAELYYNLAEALNAKEGPTGSSAFAPGYTAQSIVSDIRVKNGITSADYLNEVVAAGTDSFFELLMNERRLEFAFENMRYLDMRRNLLPMDVDIYGAKITKNVDGLETNEAGQTGTLDATTGVFTVVEDFSFEGTDPNADRIVVEDRSALATGKFDYHYLPIPQTEMLQNKNLIQNKGWNY